MLSVNSCPPLTRPHQRQSCMSGQALLHHWLCNQKHPWGICSCSPIVNFLKVTFYHEMVSLVIFLIKNHLNRHIKHENLLSIYENIDYFQIMLFTVTCWKFQKIQQPYIKRYFYVFFIPYLYTSTLSHHYTCTNFYTPGQKFIGFFLVSCKGGISWIRDEHRLLFFEYVKHHMFGPSGHGSVPQNNEQPFKFPMSN